MSNLRQVFNFVGNKLPKFFGLKYDPENPYKARLNQHIGGSNNPQRHTTRSTKIGPSNRASHNFRAFTKRARSRKIRGV